MEHGSDVFNFVALRPPEAVESNAVSLPSLDDLGGADKTVELYQRLVRTYDRADTGGFFSLIEEEGPERALAALLLGGAPSAVVNSVASRVRSEVAEGLPVVVGHLPLRPEPQDDFSDFFDIDGPTEEGETVEEMMSGLPRRSYFGPVGVGDLLVVEQHLLRYQLGEVAYVENVMATEFRERVHKLTSETDTFFSSEEERLDVMEQDLQSAERFELQSASATEIAQRNALETSVDVSASYGPTVEVEAGLRYSLENSRQQSAKRASTFAQEITERSVRRAQRRTRTVREERRRNRTDHANTHRFDNTDANAEHVTGVYRYLDKVYQMRLVNRGVRFFYEFMVPNPAAYLRHLATRQPAPEGPALPTRPTLSLDDITPQSYARLIRQHGVTDATPPPTGSITATETASDRDSGASGSQRVLKEGSISIKEGYEFESATASVTAFRQHSTDPEVWITVGRQTEKKTDGWPQLVSSAMPKVFTFDEPVGQRRSVGYSFYARHDATVQIVLEVTSRPTAERMQAWKHEVYGAIHDVYQKELSEAQAARTAAAVPSGLDLAYDVAPARLRDIERTEVKRLCLQILGGEAVAARGRLSAETGGAPVSEDVMTEGSGTSVLDDDPTLEGFPLVVERNEAPLRTGSGQIDLERLGILADEVRFGEQAFEWSGMTFSLYPYYWTAPQEWPDLARLEHPDSTHGAFLRAGMARVLVPVRPNYEEAIHDFLLRGRPALSDAETVEITSKQWLPLYQEIREAQESRSKTETLVDTWQADLPTTLVMLDIHALPTASGRLLESDEPGLVESDEPG